MKASKIGVVMTACALTLFAAGAVAEDQTSTRQGASSGNSTTADSRNADKESRTAAQQVEDATKVVKRMESESDMRKMLQEARGVFIVPKYGRVALGVGGRGGAGVLLVKRGSTWSDPAFYNIGGASIGLQAGAEGGSIAFVLNNQKAVDSFMRDNNWSLNADAGLTIVNWSKKAEGSASKGDVTVWADTRGLLGDAAISVTDIKFDKNKTAGYYGKQQVALRDVIDGKVSAPRQVAALKQALPAGAGATSSGESSGGMQTGSSQKRGSSEEKGSSGRSYGK